MDRLLEDATARPWWIDVSVDKKFTIKIRGAGLLVAQAKPSVPANARLIVTAVNSYEPMLAALEGLVKAINTKRLASAMACHSIEDFSNVMDALEPAIAAIALAKGEAA